MRVVRDKEDSMTPTLTPNPADVVVLPYVPEWTTFSLCFSHTSFSPPGPARELASSPSTDPKRNAFFNSAKRKRTDDLESESDGVLTDAERKATKLSKAASGSRRGYLNAGQRKLALEKDESICQGSVTPQSVKCNGCLTRVKLNAEVNKPYQLRNWERHKSKCSQITGKVTIRTSFHSDEGGSYRTRTVNAVSCSCALFLGSC